MIWQLITLKLYLGLDGQRAILYGGVGNVDNSDSDGVIAPVDESLYVLDLADFTWYVPNTSGDSPQSGRLLHKATVIAKYMVITFGKYDIFIYY